MKLSVLLLERSGAWRSFGLAAVSTTALLPVLPLLAGIFHVPAREIYTQAADFLPLAAKSIASSSAGAIIALALGLAAGILHSFYLFRGAALFRFIFLIPVMMPPLLWASGLKNLHTMFGSHVPGISVFYLFQGETGMAFITLMITFPIVMLATMSACSVVSNGQRDAARLSGGEAGLFRLSALFAMPAAGVAAFLGACLMLSCPGPGLALGAKTAVSEILVSFSAFYNQNLAALQCVLLSGAILLIAALIMKFTGKRPAEILAVNASGTGLRFHPVMSPTALAFNTCCALLLVFLPLWGLLMPALAAPDLNLIGQTLSRTLSNTIIYAAGAAAVAVMLGTLAAFFMGKSTLHRNAGAAVMLVVFSLPSALTSLGVLAAGAQAPAWTDFLFRSQAAVCIAQGIRLFPIPALLVSRFLGSMPASWSWAAEIHGISLLRFIKKIAGPMLLRPVVTGFVVVFLLAEADVGTVLLLHPPGAQNLPLAIFTIMANAPRALIAQLGATCLLLTLLLMWVAGIIWSRENR